MLLTRTKAVGAAPDGVTTLIGRAEIATLHRDNVNTSRPLVGTVRAGRSCPP